MGFQEYVVEEGENVEVLEKGYDKDAMINRTREYTWENIVLKEKQVYEEVSIKGGKSLATGCFNNNSCLQR